MRTVIPGRDRLPRKIVTEDSRDAAAQRAYARWMSPHLTRVPSRHRVDPAPHVSGHGRRPDRHAAAAGPAALLLGALLLVTTACGSSGGDSSSTTTKPATTTTKPASTTTEPSGSSSTTAPAGGSDATRTAWQANATEHRGQAGQTFDYECPPGGTIGTLYGVETYTDDSSVCSAAVHVGLITLEEGGSVTIQMAAGRSTYDAGVAHDVTSTWFGKWPSSFTFPKAPPGSGKFELSPESWGMSAAGMGLRVGDTATIECSKGGPARSVWGTDTYTADSSICSAAVHKGVITLDAGGKVTIQVTAGQASYKGSTANGVTSSDYGTYPMSYTFPG